MQSRVCCCGVAGVCERSFLGDNTLNTDARSIDLHRFRRLAAEARAASPPDAVARFSEALDLRRGEPLAPLNTPWADDLRHSLQAERLSVRLDCHDAALAAGKHAALLGDLAAIQQDYPLDERVAGQVDAGAVPQRTAS